MFLVIRISADAAEKWPPEAWVAARGLRQTIQDAIRRQYWGRKAMVFGAVIGAAVAVR